MSADTTVIYYTSQREKPTFEAMVRRSLWRQLKRRQLPLISVSQFPVAFGHNICVGDVGTSPLNAFRQMQIGALAATTPYVLTAEADFLYPPEYFHLPSVELDVFQIVAPIWILFAESRNIKTFVIKSVGDAGAMKVGRERLIARIDEILIGMPQWAAGAAGGGFCSLVDPYEIRRELIALSRPVLSFKTDQNMHRKTLFRRGSNTQEIPYWGSVRDVLARYQP